MLTARWREAAAVATGLAVTFGLLVAPATGAETGDTGLARFHHQRVDWHSCQQGPRDADGQALDQAGAQCAEVAVPLDYRHPDRRTITVAISRLKASDPAQRIGPLFINLGGPAIPVLARVVDARQAMGETGARFDLIGMDPRFTGRSTPLDCGWPSSWTPRSAGASRRSFERVTRLASDLARRCARRHGDLLPYTSTAASARDMDVIRAALGDSKLSFLGYSYGTYLGAVYAQLFPDRAGRMVLDSAIDPSDAGTHPRGENAPEREAGLRDWATWAAGHDDQFHLGATADQVLSTVERVYRASARHPLRVGRYLVDDTVVPGLLLNPLSDEGRISAGVRRAVKSVMSSRRTLTAPSSPQCNLPQKPDSSSVRYSRRPSARAAASRQNANRSAAGRWSTPITVLIAFLPGGFHREQTDQGCRRR